jgi:hypothetical protein
MTDMRRGAARLTILLCLVLAGMPSLAGAQSWVPVDDMAVGRYYHHIFVLPSGRAIVVVEAGSSPNQTTSTSELFDPTTSTWAPGPSSAQPHNDSSAVRLADGRILVAGGRNQLANLSNAEIYNPATNSWSVTGSMNRSRVAHSLTLLPNGKVLAAGA